MDFLLKHRLLASYAALKKIEGDAEYRVRIGLKRTLDEANEEEDDDEGRQPTTNGDVDGQTAKFAALSTDNGQKAYQAQQSAALYGPPQASAAAWYGGYVSFRIQKTVLKKWFDIRKTLSFFLNKQGMPATAVPPVVAMPSAAPAAAATWSMPPARPPWGAALPAAYAAPPRF